MMRRPLVILFLALAAANGPVDALDFGRLFTTPAQRESLDELRRTQPDVVIEVSNDELEVDQGPSEQVVRRDQLRVKGLVYRSDGKNSVWINESNSYEGDLASDYTSVEGNRIYKDRVELRLPGENRPLSLKVGQSFDPESKQVSDVTDKENNEAPVQAQDTPRVQDGR